MKLGDYEGSGSWIKHQHLTAPEMVVTITGVSEHKFDEDKYPRLCLAFREFPDMRLALNQINSATLAEIFGRDTHAENLIGRQLLLRKDKTSFNNQVVDCVRVHQAAEQRAQPLTPQKPVATGNKAFEQLSAQAEQATTTVGLQAIVRMAADQAQLGRLAPWEADQLTQYCNDKIEGMQG